MNTYAIGDLVQVQANFTNAAGAATDPTTVTAFYKNASAPSTSISVTKVSTGVYTAQISCVAAGQYAYRFVGVGALQAAMEGAFFVNQTNFE